MRTFLLLTSTSIALLNLFGSSLALAHGKGLYDTKAEAQARAEELDCTNIHKNNGKWMPCANERELHRQLRKQ